MLAFDELYGEPKQNEMEGKLEDPRRHVENIAMERRRHCFLSLTVFHGLASNGMCGRRSERSTPLALRLCIENVVFSVVIVDRNRSDLNCSQRYCGSHDNDDPKNNV